MGRPGGGTELPPRPGVGAARARMPAGPAEPRDSEWPRVGPATASGAACSTPLATPRGMWGVRRAPGPGHQCSGSEDAPCSELLSQGTEVARRPLSLNSMYLTLIKINTVH